MVIGAIRVKERRYLDLVQIVSTKKRYTHKHLGNVYFISTDFGEHKHNAKGSNIRRKESIENKWRGLMWKNVPQMGKKNEKVAVHRKGAIEKNEVYILMPN